MRWRKRKCRHIWTQTNPGFGTVAPGESFCYTATDVCTVCGEIRTRTGVVHG